MTKIESNKANVNASVETVYAFLQDLNNYELLFPKDKVSNWESTGDSFSCKIQNTYKIMLNKKSEVANENIHLESADGSPLKFNLDVNVKSLGENETEVQMIGNADLNPFLKMMVMKPLKNLFEYMAGRISKVHEDMA